MEDRGGEGVDSDCDGCLMRWVEYDGLRGGFLFLKCVHSFSCFSGDGDFLCEICVMPLRARETRYPHVGREKILQMMTMMVLNRLVE